MNKNKIFLILIFSTFLGALGQLSFKYSLLNNNIIILLLGVLFYTISSVFYFIALSHADLSWVYSIGGFSYVFVAILSNFIEKIPIMRWFGIVFIIIGVFIIKST
ncbi:MAG: EamA family transporter [Caldisericia bacterium]